jgi:hypothetical protein
MVQNRKSPLVVLLALLVSPMAYAQYSQGQYPRSQYPRSSYGSYDQLSQIEAGAVIPVRTNQTIDARTADGRVFTGVVDEDVFSADGRLAIPRGARAELIVRNRSNSDLVLDLESVTVNGQRYAVRASTEAAPGQGPLGPIGANEKTGQYVGGGALLGGIIGAIAGGGKGAAIGAVVGGAAGAGAEVLTSGSSVSVPRGSILTFRLTQPLDLGVADNGYTRNGVHYHRYGQNNQY